MTLRPMPPTPITMADWPWVGLARLNTAPTPVSTAQPMRLADASGTSGSITTAWVSFTTVCSANTPALANWNALLAADRERRPQLAERCRGSGSAGRGRTPRTARSCRAW